MTDYIIEVIKYYLSDLSAIDVPTNDVTEENEFFVNHRGKTFLVTVEEFKKVK